MDGIIVINKPKNCTSHDIVRKAKKILNEKEMKWKSIDGSS